MRIFQMLGIDDKRILTGGYCTEGKVTEIKIFHWLKVNTKPVRTNALDGAKFPHIIRFTYCVNGTEYQGSRYVNWDDRCPVKDERITPCFHHPCQDDLHYGCRRCEAALRYQFRSC